MKTGAIENNAGEKHLMFRVPRIGKKLPKMAQNSPKFSKNGHFSIIMPQNRVVSQKTLRTYIPVKTIAKNIF